MWNNPSVPAFAHPSNLYLLACAAGAVLVLLLLIARLRLHPALALAVAALGLGLASGMPVQQVSASFTAGVGGLMGHIAIVLGLGAILGRLLAVSGGASALCRALTDRCGPRGLPWALLALGLIVGLPVFFEVGLVLMMPIVAATSRRAGRAPILVGIPLLAGLSIVHGTLPPHPAAMLAVTQYHADVGRTILMGLLVAIPAGVMAGPVLAWCLGRFAPKLSAHMAQEPVPFSEGATQPPADVPEPDEPETSVGPVRAAAAILLPIALIFLGSWADALFTAGSALNRTLHFLGNPDVALLIAVLVALVTLGPHIPAHGKSRKGMLRRLVAESFEPIANVLMILAAAGGLSGILRDSGAAQATVGVALGAHMPPLLLAWLLAAVVRVSMGSATVAMAVASGVLAPAAAQVGLRPELLVLATGTGSLVFSHVNDPGFWMIQSFFNMEMKETFATWTVLESVLSIVGLAATLTLSLLMH